MSFLKCFFFRDKLGPINHNKDFFMLHFFLYWSISFQGIPDFDTIENLVDVLTNFIYICSVEHSATNFPQYDQYAFPPNFAAKLQNVPKVYIVWVYHFGLKRWLSCYYQLTGFILIFKNIDRYLDSQYTFREHSNDFLIWLSGVIHIVMHSIPFLKENRYWLKISMDSIKRDIFLFKKFALFHTPAF